ncbi:MAG: hydrogenase maturation nickel metallochaperone HypA [PVC group bacterium]|nr:hydrogenase maturation nickel metallochaperone HypA [PVC group bacterium]
MHEMSIASALMDQIMETAKLNNLVKVEEVEIQAGLLKQVVPDVMQAAFEAVISGTIVEGARLKIIEVKAEARCLSCGQVFEPKVDNFLCSVCNKADVEIIKGNEIILKSLTGKNLEEEDKNES